MIPTAFKRTDGTFTAGSVTVPTVDQSDLPILLGLDSLKAKRAILDMDSLVLHFVGPGGAKIDLPPGSESFQLEHSQSGHLVLPCGEFHGLKHQKETINDVKLNLHANPASA